MQSLSDSERNEVLGEVLSDQLRVIMEYVKDIPHIKRRVDTLEEDMREVKSDVKNLKVAVSDMSHTLKSHGRQLKSHGRKLTRLEALIKA